MNRELLTRKFNAMEKDVVDYLNDKRTLEGQIRVLKSKEQLSEQETIILAEMQRYLSKLIKTIESMSR